MTTKDWRAEVGEMLVLRREIVRLLNKIAKCFDETGKEFDENFRHEFFEITNSAFLMAYSNFLTVRLSKRLQKYAILNDGNETRPNIKIEKIEFSSACDDSADVFWNNSTVKLETNENEENLTGYLIDDAMNEDFELIDEIKIEEPEFSQGNQFDTNDDERDQSEASVSDLEVDNEKKGNQTINRPISSKPSISQSGKHFQCDYCQYITQHKSHLIRHMRLHIGEKPYECKKCQKTFANSGSLKKHTMRMHSNERPYKCTECPKSFITSGFLRAHLRFHAGEKPYKCNMCSKAYTDSSGLKVHKRIHTGERPYKCEHCPKTFSTSGNLIKHMRYHTGEKPFECKECSKTFSESCHLIRHMRTHTGERPHKCNLCSKQFTRFEHLKRHKALVHAC